MMWHVALTSSSAPEVPAEEPDVADRLGSEMAAIEPTGATEPNEV